MYKLLCFAALLACASAGFIGAPLVAHLPLVRAAPVVHTHVVHAAPLVYALHHHHHGFYFRR
ncbi:larval/pupal cuticle protein H1C-like precursor [Tribolium castaneum]|uniref:larval/pupal cuticle protein H1C-like precursor n=1 Tax=Tribolium castaneum TaxID=7070 RepID=UPI0023078693|nr:larval/pupal cuticle protein H1C-like precursor [Tribolium castaneum]